MPTHRTEERRASRATKPRGSLRSWRLFFIRGREKPCSSGPSPLRDAHTGGSSPTRVGFSFSFCCLSVGVRASHPGVEVHPVFVRGGRRFLVDCDSKKGGRGSAQIRKKPQFICPTQCGRDFLVSFFGFQFPNVISSSPTTDTPPQCKHFLAMVPHLKLTEEWWVFYYCCPHGILYYTPPRTPHTTNTTQQQIKR